MKWYIYATIFAGIIIAVSQVNRIRVMNDLKKIYLSRNFTLDEMVKTSTGVENIPGEKEIEALRQLCLKILQPLRDFLQLPVIVTNAYRSPVVNSLTEGSSKTSQHPKGQAADIKVKKSDGTWMTNQEIINAIRHLRLPYDQLIDEEKTNLTGVSKWVHVSHDNTNAIQRLQWMTRRDTGPNRLKEYETVKLG